MFYNLILMFFKDINREKAPSNKTPTLPESMNMEWRIGYFVQHFRKDKSLVGFVQKSLHSFCRLYEMKPLRKSYSCVKSKTISNFAVNLPELLKEATNYFCLFD